MPSKSAILTDTCCQYIFPMALVCIEIPAAANFSVELVFSENLSPEISLKHRKAFLPCANLHRSTATNLTCIPHWLTTGDRVGVGTDVYALAAPRQVEFGLRLTFLS
jgi:hypothetical protein